MTNRTFEICGIEFEAVRFHKPIKHWRLKVPSGNVYQGVVSGKSVPKMISDLERHLKLKGKESFIREWNEA